MEPPRRKPNRLRNYDYSRAGAYFITICTKDKEHLLGTIQDIEDTSCTNNNICTNDIVGASIARPIRVKLSPYGQIVDRAINMISSHYPTVSVDNYVIMPNHIHLLLRISNKKGRAMLAPTNVSATGEVCTIGEVCATGEVSAENVIYASNTPSISHVVQHMKGYVTKQIGRSIWQKLFHDHVIRNMENYRTIAAYIQNNPRTWATDCFHRPLS